MDMTGGDRLRADGGADLTVRQARAADADAVAAFTRDTWSEQGASDYLPDVFPHWVESDGPDQRTFVVDVDDGADVAGVLQGVMLSDTEAWAQGMRVNPDYRGRGLGTKLTRAVFQWARDRGAVVCRNMVFSWNVAGLGTSRAGGFRPGVEFRWATPEPDGDAEPTLTVEGDAAAADAAWAFWQRSDARTELDGLVMDDEETWACSELRREQLREAAAADRLFTVVDGGTRGFTYRSYTTERDADDGGTETLGVYGVAVWDDVETARALYRAVARDAAAEGIDSVRVLIPESVRWVSDTAATRTGVSDEPDFLLTADLTDDALF